MTSLRKYTNISLSELKNYSRRLHAKLIAWYDGRSVGCITGSANFTTAAMGGGNIEACLLIRDAGQLIGELFDRDIEQKPISFDDFEPGPGEEVEANEDDSIPIWIQSAILFGHETITVSYKHRLEHEPDALWLTIRVPGETRPRYQHPLPTKREATVSLSLGNKAVVDSSGTLLATVVADLNGQKHETSPYWIVQESRLTFEPGESQSSSENKIVETGEGLPEFIDALGGRDGMAAVIEYLRHLNIKYEDGAGGFGGLRPFKLTMHDPYRPDDAPGWLLDAPNDASDLGQAIYEFADRHEHRRLLRHVARGNINGMGNYLDILTALTRLLFIYRARNVVTWQQVQMRFLKYVQISTGGAPSGEVSFGGYLTEVFRNLGWDSKTVAEVCSETNYLAEVRAVLWLAQYMRFVGRKDRNLLRVKDMLPSHVRAFHDFLKVCGLRVPGHEAVRSALERYNMLTEKSLNTILL